MSYHPRWDVEGRDWPNRSASRFVDAGQLRWHVQLMGNGPPLLLLHGTGAATHSWRTLMPLLAAHFTVIAPDMPGHGFTSGRPPGGLAMTAMARAVGGLMTAMDLSPRCIVGHSAGAAVALRMVADGHAQPDCVVGLNAALMPFPGIAARLFPTLAKLLFVNPFAPSIFARMARDPADVAKFLARSTGSRIDAAGVRHYAALFATPGHCSAAITMMADWDLPSLQAALPGITVPVLLAHGQGDSAIPAKDAQAAAAIMPNADMTILSGLGHLAHEEAPERIAAIIADHAMQLDQREEKSREPR
ncbi:alpha/beta fold hydrolase BchO [Sphingobium algorifonticola]|uniref:Alpha/beta fold hydrolase n=1 Tax=Sphingobium algorifonticola TaxID=2008318 RepID=A0A437J622_9SPHN|nr:alpha/beta fold hydrolase BchO [Sphingobium algorifonticola]RVT40233.1 alpha/beta fold hydrolase [Sphingobium algorifonticola]